MQSNKCVIAITGGIGAGKTTVCQYLSSKGYSVIDCDEISRKVSSSSVVLEEIKEAFGSRFVVDGSLCRKDLREYVFANQERVAILNKIFLDKILCKLLEEINLAQGKIIFVEVTNFNPLIKKYFDKIWLITAHETERINRVVFRDDVSAQSVEKIICRQNDVLEPDEIIVNDDYTDKLYARLDCLLQTLTT